MSAGRRNSRTWSSKIVARCRELGFDPATQLLPVAPAQHYASGGVRTDLRGRDYYWMSFRGEKQEHAEGTDLQAIEEGRISVTPLHIDLTHMETVNNLKGVLGGAPPKA